MKEGEESPTSDKLQRRNNTNISNIRPSSLTVLSDQPSLPSPSYYYQNQESSHSNASSLLHPSTGTPYDGSKWDLSRADGIDPTLTISQFSIATTETANTFAATTSTVDEEEMDIDSSEDDTGPVEDDEMKEEGKLKGKMSAKKGRKNRSRQYGVAISDESHVNYIFMYEMLSGIRTAVSWCQAKMLRALTETDFRFVKKFGFGDGSKASDSQLTPSSKYEFKFKDYCPWVFRVLRESFSIDAADYLVSLTGRYVLSEMGSSGKSGSFFYYSQDYRFIMKTVHRGEHQFLRKILRFYFEHIIRNPNSLLTRFYGLHRLQMSKTRKVYFVVMGNIFPPNKDLHEVYDLKGSTYGRVIEDEVIKKSIGPVTLKDLNWVKNGRSLILGPEKGTLLLNQLKSDCLLLSKLRIMDYSLLVGIHIVSRGNIEGIRDRTIKLVEPEDLSNKVFKKSTIISSAWEGVPKERRKCVFYADEGGFRSTYADNTSANELYFLGIIDILTPYTATKRIEHAFKSVAFGKERISAVDPLAYYQRFISFMTKNILRDRDSDYASRALPAIPVNYRVEDARIGGSEQEKEAVAVYTLEDEQQ